MADLSLFTLIAPALFGPSLGGLLDADSSPQQRQAYELVMCADQLGPRYATPYLQAATRLTSAEFVQQALGEARRQGENLRLRAQTQGGGSGPAVADPAQPSVNAPSVVISAMFSTRKLKNSAIATSA